MNAMLLAAGLGTRLAPLTEQFAKPSIPLLQIPMLCYPLFALETLGLERLVINTHHLPNTIEDCVEKYLQEVDYEIHFSSEQPTILDSGGGIGHARKLLTESVSSTSGWASSTSDTENIVVANGDAVLLLKDRETIWRLHEQHQVSEALATILVLPHACATGEHNSVWADTNGQVKAIGKNPPMPDAADSKRSGVAVAGHFNAGIIVMSKRIFEYIPENRPSHIFKDVFLPAIEKGELIKIHNEPQAAWFETGDLAHLNEATRLATEILSDANSSRAMFKDYLQEVLERFSLVTSQENN